MGSDCEINVQDTETSSGREVNDGDTLTAAQKARAEHNRQKARMLREARLVQPNKNGKSNTVENTAVIDTGGGFFLEEETSGPPAVVAQPAPIVHPSEQPHCMECDQQFPQSYLMDTFDYNVCDSCRDDEVAHALITRTEAKSEFLLKDCDLDSRPPPLRCVRRRNPHRARFSDMRLYLRAQVEARALVVWGSAELLEEERSRRRDRSQRARQSAAARRLRDLRMDVRSSLYDRSAPHHEHVYGPERYLKDEDLYERVCECGHVQTYEKM